MSYLEKYFKLLILSILYKIQQIIPSLLDHFKKTDMFLTLSFKET